MKTLPLFLLSASLLLTACCAQPPPGPPPVRKVTVIGTATINVAPDQMYWTVQVSFHGATLATAKKKHDASLQDVLTYIKSLGGAVKDLQTAGIRFDKQTDFPDKADRSRPYSCSTQLTFTLKDFDQYAPICDTLAKIDGVEVQPITYAYSKQSDTRREALKQALLNARDKADDLATTASCALGTPIDVAEFTADAPYALMDNSTARAASADTPAAVAGQIAINGSVRATYDLVPK